jgi:hypothetical protein
VNLVEAQIVSPALEDCETQGARQRWFQRVDEPGKVAFDELTLQGDGRRGNDDRAVGLNSTPNRRHQVCQRLAGTGPGLHGKVLTGVECRGDGLCHRHLAGAFTAVERVDGSGQQRGHFVC